MCRRSCTLVFGANLRGDPLKVVVQMSTTEMISRLCCEHKIGFFPLWFGSLRSDYYTFDGIYKAYDDSIFRKNEVIKAAVIID